MQRKTFIRKFALWTSSMAGVIAGISFLRQWYPPSLIKKNKVKLVDVHKYPVDTYSYLDQYGIFIYRDHEGIRAVSAICTHLGCTLQKTTDGFECPCHGSKYSDQGEVLSGPAPSGLKWFNIYTAYDGNLVVDLNRTVDADFKFKVS